MPVFTPEREAWFRERVFTPGAADGDITIRPVRDLFDTLDEARTHISLYETENADNARVKWVLQHVEAATAFFKTVRRLRARAELLERGSLARTELLDAANEMAAELRALFGEGTI